MGKMRGIIAVTVTPFKDDGGIDFDAAARHVNWLIESGVHGLLPLGATGEFAALSIAERKAFAEFVMEKAGGRVPVMIGAVSQNQDVVLEISRHAASIKADAVMIQPPPGLSLSQDEIYAYYASLSAQVDLPVMVYNNPGSSGVDIAPELMERIAALPRMDYLKESTGDIMRLTCLVDALEEEMDIFCGCESLAYESFVMGAKGWICVIANVAPKQAVELFTLLTEKKDLQKARVLYRKLLPLLRLTEDSGELWQLIKYILQRQGMGNGGLRAPRLPISARSKAAADALLESGSFC